MSKNKKTFWQRIVGIGRRKLIAGALAVGLACVGINLPPHTVDAVVIAADSVIEAMSEQEAVNDD